MKVSTTIAFATAANRHVTANEQSKNVTGGCDEACTIIRTAYPDLVIGQDSVLYNNFTAGYWARQQQLATPKCIFTPNAASEISHALKSIVQADCAFAVRSGGHGPFPSVSSNDDGIVISMASFDEVTVSSDRKSAFIGTGNKWIDVYTALEPHELTVPGGRHPTVGTGGLSLGGGLAYFSNAYGWTCDNIREYEIVLEDGSSLNVSQEPHSDLWWALRGGGNNFGIVTRITMDTIPLPGGLIWGGRRITNITEVDKLIKAAYNLGTTGVEQDRGVGQLLNIGVAQGMEFAGASFTNIQPKEAPEIMSEFLEIPYIMDSVGVKTLVNNSASGVDGGGLGTDGTERRRGRGTTTMKLSIEMMTFVKDTFLEERKSIDDIATNVDTIAVFQIISKPQLEVSEQKGGNAMGLSPEDGPLFLLSLFVGWDVEEKDERLGQFIRNVIGKVNAEAEARGESMRFRYMNYAGEFQDVIAGYGKENKARLIEVARKYDPARVFQRLQPGWFKLHGAPIDAQRRIV